MEKQLLIIFETIKARYQGILTQREQTEFWECFGAAVYDEFLKEGYEKIFINQQEENLKPLKEFMKTNNYIKWQNKQFKK